MENRKVEGVYRGEGFHWVGDGFHVTQVVPGRARLSEKLNPFLLMDYHAPYDYSPTDTPRGVGVHPHRGFETVTVAFEGSLAHHDSSGGGGVINAGDVQWMTAASGILHKEYHEKEWAKKGGQMHMMQLWVNLPAAHKMDDPSYQPILASDMGKVNLADDAGEVTVISGEFQGVKGPAKTFTPITLWRAQLNKGAKVDFEVDSSQNLGVFVMEGQASVNGQTVGEHSLAVLDNNGSGVSIAVLEGADIIVLGGEPINEPVVSYGPFVMNSMEEIAQAFEDFESGKFGYLAG